MPPDDVAQAMRQLVAAVLDVQPLVDVLPPPVRVAASLDERLLNAVATELGMSRFATLPVPDQLDPFERVVSGRLAQVSAPVSAPGNGNGNGLPPLAEIVDAVRSGSFQGRYPPVGVRAADGVALRAYPVGAPREVAVVLASACGMPARLCAPWLRRLAADHFVVTYETRGLFGSDSADFTGATDMAAQAGDLLAILDHFGVRRAHVVGLCGGAVVALAAAAAWPERIGSLSLWHGDYELGADSPKTDHQRDLQALLNLVAQERVTPAALHTAITGSMLRGAPPELAHLVLYPYATPSLLHRYCKLNGAIMQTDVRAYLGGQPCPPTLVVTSEDDATAHPDGSRFVATALGSRLHVRPNGDHLSLFQEQPELLELAAAFIAEAEAGIRAT